VPYPVVRTLAPSLEPAIGGDAVGAAIRDINGAEVIAALLRKEIQRRRREKVTRSQECGS
jgi:hypothetical protein